MFVPEKFQNSFQSFLICSKVVFPHGIISSREKTPEMPNKALLRPNQIKSSLNSLEAPCSFLPAVVGGLRRGPLDGEPGPDPGLVLVLLDQPR